MQEPFIPGRQMAMISLCGFSDRELEKEYRDKINEGGGYAELVRTSLFFFDLFGASTEEALDNLRRGGSVDPGIYVGNITNIVLTATEFPSGLDIITSFDELFELK